MPHKERMFLDLPDVDLNKFKLGDKVTATVSGELFELTAEVKDPPEEEGDMDFSRPPRVGIKITGKAKLSKTKKNSFDKRTKWYLAS